MFHQMWQAWKNHWVSNFDHPIMFLESLSNHGRMRVALCTALKQTWLHSYSGYPSHRSAHACTVDPLRVHHLNKCTYSLCFNKVSSCKLWVQKNKFKVQNWSQNFSLQTSVSRKNILVIICEEKYIPEPCWETVNRYLFLLLMDMSRGVQGLLLKGKGCLISPVMLKSFTT